MAPQGPGSIGPYQVVKDLGRGGMGAVMEVRSPKGDTLALKLIDKQRWTGFVSHRHGGRDAGYVAPLIHRGVSDED